MKSSDWERLGDWQRKQQWGFEDSLKDVAIRQKNNIPYQRGGEAPMPSACISTDRSTLKRKKRTQ